MEEARKEERERDIGIQIGRGRGAFWAPLSTEAILIKSPH
jgi:hypothetical protein